jgi:hypothetical protein
MSNHPNIPPAMKSPDEFRPEKFKNKSSARDYVIYAVALVVVLGVIGGSVYYFTRSKAEKDELRAKLDETITDAGLRPDPTQPAKLKTPKLGNLMGEEGAEGEAKVAGEVAPKTGSKPVAVSTYSGGGPNRVVLSTDPKLPQASLGFIQFAEALKVSSVVQGSTPKLMIAGKMYRAGEVIDEEQAVTFVSVDREKSLILFRDKKGAELHLSF